jgi:hypothetical protein
MPQKVIIIINEHTVFRCCVCVDWIASDRLRMLRKILDLRQRKQQETGDDCIMRSFMICTDHQILFG